MFIFSTKVTKYIFSIIVIVIYLLFCMFVNIGWQFKFIGLMPTTFLFWMCAKYIAPEYYDNEIEITGKYDGGDFGDIGGCAMSDQLMGNFGCLKKEDHTDYFNPYYNSLYDKMHYGYSDVYRTYECLCIFLIWIPINCLAVSRGKTETKYDGSSSTGYRIYGKCKWNFFEAILVFLGPLSILLTIIGIIGFFN